MALIKAIELLLLQEEEKNPGAVFDKKFIEEHTSGYQDFINHIKHHPDNIGTKSIINLLRNFN